MKLGDLLAAQGAALASDGIPLHFGDLTAEYHAALTHAVLMLRSHEGRLELRGRDRLNLMHRMSTNDLLTMAIGEGRPTIFTDANARILDRALVFHRGESALVITEPGRGAALSGYLQRNIFFNDEVYLTDLAAQTHQFALHGALADRVMEALAPDAALLKPLRGMDAIIADAACFVAHNKPLSVSHWTLVVPAPQAGEVWSALMDAGAPLGLAAAGSLTYNTLRIRAGRPGVNRELSPAYIPLEVGLWDEISFRKGCYTGQEIIARMESRSRLAKVMVTLCLDSLVEAPADIFHEGRVIGTLTSSVTTPDGEQVAIGVIKPTLAQPEQVVSVGAANIRAKVVDLAASPPPMVTGE